MPAGFFPPSANTNTPSFMVPRCGACGLYKKCKSPKMPHSGKGQRRILIVGEAPGRNEDHQNKHFVDESGQILESALKKLGVNMRRDCWLTNSLICRPPDNTKPSKNEVYYCRPNLLRTIDELKPTTIILLGKSAVQSLIGSIWKEDIGEIDRWVGWRIPNRKPNAWICPTWHPSHLASQKNPVLDLWFQRHLKSAVALLGPPWRGELPRYEDSIEIIENPAQAALRIREMMLLGDFPAAFDYETTCLKPDSDIAEIVCCSISWGGKKTIAYPWTKKTAAATSDFLLSDAPKIASNLKFESRWTMVHLGHPVKRWRWDTMQAAHVLDCRNPKGGGITSIKFQAYVRLGQVDYDSHIKPYFQPKGIGLPNRIRELDIRTLLKYCGMDSLLEYKVAELQMKEMEGKNGFKKN